MRWFCGLVSFWKFIGTEDLGAELILEVSAGFLGWLGHQRPHGCMRVTGEGEHRLGLVRLMACFVQAEAPND